MAAGVGFIAAINGGLKRACQTDVSRPLRRQMFNE